MNKKLQEFAFESGYDFYQDGTQTRITSNKNLEKFAELLIQDCVGNLLLHGYDDAVDQLIKYFKGDKQ